MNFSIIMYIYMQENVQELKDSTYSFGIDIEIGSYYFRLKWVEEEIQKPSFGQGWESWPHLLEKVLWGKVQWLWKPVKLLIFYIFDILEVAGFDRS